MSTNKVNYYKRVFLNKPHFESSAHIIYALKYNQGDMWIDYRFRIADCNRHIELTFSNESKKHYENSIKKLNILLEETQKFKEAFQKASELKGVAS